MRFVIVFISILCLPLRGADWPHWRGPDRNDVIGESSRWKPGAWPGKELWQRNFGQGSTSPIVVKDRLYTMGWKNNRDAVICVEAATGKDLWTTSYPSPQYSRYSLGDKHAYYGPSSTPEFDVETGYLYTLSLDGDLHCWDTGKKGEKVWALNLYDRFKAPQRPKIGRAGRRDYGYTTAPLVWKEQLLVEVGSPEGALMSFDKKTGRRLWTSQARDAAGHTGGMALMTVEGVPCVVVLTLHHLMVIRLDKGNEGKTLAEYPWQTDYANSITSPVVHRNEVLITSGYNNMKMVKLGISKSGARKIWESREPSSVCTPIVYKNHIYLAWRGVKCVDYQTGQLKWRGGHVESVGSCILTSDERLIVWANQGDLMLVETAQRSPDNYRELFKKTKIFNRDVWPHIVLSNGRLFCRDKDGNMKCFALGGK